MKKKPDQAKKPKAATARKPRATVKESLTVQPSRVPITEWPAAVPGADGKPVAPFGTFMVPVSMLRFKERNANRMNPAERAQLRISVRKFGMVTPIVVNLYPGREGVLVGGNHRVEAEIEAGTEAVPCTFVYLDQRGEDELSIRLNKIHGSQDNEILAGFDPDFLTEAGFSLEELDAIYMGGAEDEPGAGGPAAPPEAPILSMELRPYESFDYLVFVFRDVESWGRALQAYGVTDVVVKELKDKKTIGLGRVLDGRLLLQGSAAGDHGHRAADADRDA
jgi:hypothetical protein